MQTFYIRKKIEAPTMAEAIRREKKAPVIEIYAAENNTTAIGFTVHNKSDHENK